MEKLLDLIGLLVVSTIGLTTLYVMFLTWEIVLLSIAIVLGAIVIVWSFQRVFNNDH